MRKYIIALIILISTGCTQRGCQRFERSFQYSERHYIIQQYSGGKLVNEWNFKGILNNEENSDGYFFFKGDTLIEVSGDIVVKSVN